MSIRRVRTISSWYCSEMNTLTSSASHGLTRNNALLDVVSLLIVYNAGLHVNLHRVLNLNLLGMHTLEITKARIYTLNHLIGFKLAWGFRVYIHGEQNVWFFSRKRTICIYSTHVSNNLKH